MNTYFKAIIKGLGVVLLLGHAISAFGAEAMDATQVKLLPGSVFYDRQELHRTVYLASWEPDRLLFSYRALAGLPQSGGAKAYSGWDSGFLRGHMAGHYLSAASRMAAATGDSKYRDRVNYMVAELGKCQDALGTGYLAGFSTAAFDKLEGKPGSKSDIVVPYYTMHKLLAGLLDAHHYVGNKQSLEIAVKLADYFENRCAALPPQTIEAIFRTDSQRNPQNEFGAMADAMTTLYQVTGDRRHLEFAKLFNRDWFVKPLSEGQDKLAGLHANTHIAAAVGLAHFADVTKDVADARASENFWSLVTKDHSFVNGGNSFREWFDKPGIEVGPSMDAQAALPPTTAESCNTHNMLKLTTWLFDRKPSVEYADYYENALYNHLLTTAAPDTGAVTYFTPMRGQFRTYLNGTFCCVGSGLENTARYNEGIYFHDTDALWVNLYIPSEADWPEQRLTFRQEGDVLRGQPVRITITQAGDKPVSLNLRVPNWVAAPAVLTLNGKAEPSAGTPSTYLTLKRVWKAGDVLTLTLPAALRLERAKDDASMVSVFYGPVILAGELGRQSMPNDLGDKDANLKLPAVAVPDVVNSSANPADWLRTVPNEPLAFAFHDAGGASGIVLRPFYAVHHERYSLYWRLR
jgi:hypothetical protein